MAARTLLQIVRAACDEIGLPRPSAVVGSTDAQAVQMLALLNREGREVSRRDGANGGWPQLRREHSITLVDSQASYAFPSDLAYFINTTGWDQSNNWPLDGPISPQIWQVLKSGTIGSVGPRLRFRIMAGALYVDPTPDSSNAGNTLVLEYYSESWCESSVADPQTSWLSDSDVPRLPDDIFVLGLIWRWRRAKGLDYQEEFNAYEDYVAQSLARSGMSRVLDLGGIERVTRLLTEDNIPDSGFGGV